MELNQSVFYKLFSFDFDSIFCNLFSVETAVAEPFLDMEAVPGEKLLMSFELVYVQMTINVYFSYCTSIAHRLAKVA